MCGIFGIVSELNINFSEKDYKSCLDGLFKLSESRGKEASGFAFKTNEVFYFKTPQPASKLVKSKVYNNEINKFLISKNTHHAIIGHSRLVTNGYEQDNKNNQPVAKNGIVGVHNGIIVNSSGLWAKYNEETKSSDLDSELVPTLISRFIKEGQDVVESIQNFNSEIKGVANIAFYHSSIDGLVLATNNGSIYYVNCAKSKTLIFASERFILNTLIDEKSFSFNKKYIKQLLPKEILLVKGGDDLYLVNENNTSYKSVIKNRSSLIFREITEKGKGKVYLNKSLDYSYVPIYSTFEKKIKKRTNAISQLKRCSKCVLPQTFPFISFDKSGVCNYCNNYLKLELKGRNDFSKLLKKFRSNNKNKHDCLVPLSGGRDSSYTLHYLKKELELNPIAFSYDWGMLTNLARRNQSLMCGELGVEHILISADIRKKRKNIQKNVLAWLNKPNLGTIPLFMAGDKQYFYYTNLLMKQNELELSIMGENMLETTRFKTGFCGIEPNFNNEKTYSLSNKDKLKMLLFYGKEFLLNPSYINTSLLDTIDAFKSYYVMGHQTINIFDYLPWIESDVEDVLINLYNWETDPGTKSTWRIGDGTAAFYNYIYYMVSGFNENDTFRSNQIREGLLSRE
ncbi:MAG: hypothetical protein P8I02_02935, partial [Flavobacteriales bacterium]|nr:hypothetical protein [Flavobacteriales bacterium]